MWRALVRPAKKVQVGETLVFAAAGSDEVVLSAEVVAAGEFGERTLRFGRWRIFMGRWRGSGICRCRRIFIGRRTGPDTAEDRERYQTVYSRRRGGGGVGGGAYGGAALYAGDAGGAAGAGRGDCDVTLHVGLGTFQPVRVGADEEIRLHAERYTLPAATAEAVNRARSEGRRVVAAGTTTTRTLEHVAREAGGGREWAGLRRTAGRRAFFCRRGTSSGWWVGC